jgi:hypothetical protein
MRQVAFCWNSFDSMDDILIIMNFLFINRTNFQGVLLEVVDIFLCLYQMGLNPVVILDKKKNKSTFSLSKAKMYSMIYSIITHHN